MQQSLSNGKDYKALRQDSQPMAMFCNRRDIRVDDAAASLQDHELYKLDARRKAYGT